MSYLITELTFMCIILKILRALKIFFFNENLGFNLANAQYCKSY